MQTRWQSLIEVFTNVFIGICVSFLISTVLIPYFTGVRLKAHEYGMMTMIYTVASIIRSYLLRRFWNHVHTKQNLAIRQRIDS